ncbi:MAG: putative integral rane protein [Frankiales bacterium]|nr:putative integral rane protein [Frankiales bacterium]
MYLINQIEHWLIEVLYYGLLIFRAWALIDCLTRKAPAFPAAGKLTKPTWLLFTALSLAIGYFVRDVTNLIAYITIIVTSVYLADVRPAVREISGPSRW